MQRVHRIVETNCVTKGLEHVSRVARDTGEQIAVNVNIQILFLKNSVEFLGQSCLLMRN